MVTLSVPPPASAASQARVSATPSGSGAATIAPSAGSESGSQRPSEHSSRTSPAARVDVEDVGFDRVAHHRSLDEIALRVMARLLGVEDTETDLTRGPGVIVGDLGHPGAADQIGAAVAHVGDRGMGCR